MKAVSRPSLARRAGAMPLDPRKAAGQSFGRFPAPCAAVMSRPRNRSAGVLLQRPGKEQDDYIFDVVRGEHAIDIPTDAVDALVERLLAAARRQAA